MKIRNDFVTNSSSSSFVFEKKAIVCFPETGHKYVFCSGNEDSVYGKASAESPKNFKKFADWYYLNKGTKVTAKKMLTGSGIKKYVDFLKTQGGEKGEAKICLSNREYYIGMGESIGEDIDNENSYLLSCLHPAIRRNLDETSLYSLLFDTRGIEYIESFHIEKNARLGINKDGIYYYSFVHDRCDCSEEFYEMIYSAAGKPELPFEETASGLGRFCSEETKHAIKEQNIRILSFSSKTKKNDVVVFINGNDEIYIEHFEAFIRKTDFSEGCELCDIDDSHIKF